MLDRNGERRLIITGSVSNFLENIRLVVDGIASIFGENCEVVLHDLRRPEHSILAIANGHITGRKVGGPIFGGPLDDKGLKVILSKANTENIIANYITHTRDGRILKSTSLVFRNRRGVPAIALCINLDLTEFKVAKELLNNICIVEEKNREKKAGPKENKTGKSDITQIIRSITEEAISGLQVPIRNAKKEDKIRAIRAMYERGLFLAKGGVDYAARSLNVSRFTIYNYLKEFQYRE